MAISSTWHLMMIYSHVKPDILCTSTATSTHLLSIQILYNFNFLLVIF